MMAKNNKRNTNKKLNLDKVFKKNENININIIKDINLGNVQYKSKELKKNNLLSKAYLGVVNILSDYVDNYIDEEINIGGSIQKKFGIDKKNTTKSTKSVRNKKNLNCKDEEKRYNKSLFTKSKTKGGSTIIRKKFLTDSIDLKGDCSPSFSISSYIQRKCNSNYSDQIKSIKNKINNKGSKEKEKNITKNSSKYFKNILNKNRNIVISDDSSSPINYKEFTLIDNGKKLLENINKKYTKSVIQINKDLNNINSSMINNNSIHLSINNRIKLLKKNFNYGSQNSIVSSLPKLQKNSTKKINKKKSYRSNRNNVKSSNYKKTEIISNKPINEIPNSFVSSGRKNFQKPSSYSSNTIQRINKKDLELELYVDNTIIKNSIFSNKDELLKLYSFDNKYSHTSTKEKFKDKEKRPKIAKIKIGEIETKRKHSNSNRTYRKYKSLKQKDTAKSNKSIKTIKSRQRNSTRDTNIDFKFLNSEQIKNELYELKNNIKKQLKINFDDFSNPLKNSIAPISNSKRENIVVNDTQNLKENKSDNINIEQIIEIKKDSLIKEENTLLNNSKPNIESEIVSEEFKYNENELMNNEEKRKKIHERYRALIHKNLVYDSLDDEEIEEKERNFYFEPENKFILIFDFIIGINSFYYLIYIPIYLARNLKFCRGYILSLNEFYNLFIDLSFVCDVILSFFRSYYNFEEFLIKDTALMTHNYICSWFIIDLICAIPIFTIFMFMDEQCNLENIKFLKGISYNMNFNKTYFLLLLLKILKIFKIFSINNRMRNKIKEKLIQSDFYENWRALILQVSLTILSLNLSSCIYIFIGRNSFPSWIYSLRLKSNDFSGIYVTSIYFLIATITTVGYGDVTSFSMNEKIFHLFLLIVGICAYSWMISSVSNYIKKMSEKSASFQNRVKILDDIRLSYPDLHDDLYDKIIRHLSYRKYHEKNNKAIIIDCLPYPLRNSLIIEMYKTVIDNFIFFKGSENSDFIVKVVLSFKPILAMKNDLLVQEGEFIEDIIFVKQGVICLEIFLDIDNINECIEGYLSDNLFKNSLINNNLFTWNSQNANNIYNSLIVDNNMIDKKGLSQIEGINKSFGKTAIFFDKYKTHLVENDDSNYCKLRVIDIRRNEYFGDILMFLNLRSPLSIRVKSKKAELFFLKKMDAVNLSSSYPNIWKRINKKSVFNLEQIKIQIQKVVLTYCNTNGIKTNKESNFFPSSKLTDSINKNNVIRKDKIILKNKLQSKNESIENSNKSINLPSEGSMSGELIKFSNKSVKAKNQTISDEQKINIKKPITIVNNDMNKNRWADTSEIITEEEPSVEKEKSTPDNSNSLPSESIPDNSNNSTHKKILNLIKCVPPPNKIINNKEENDSKNEKPIKINSKKTSKIKSVTNDLISFSEINNIDIDLMLQGNNSLYDLDQNGNRITPYKCYEINDEIYNEENSNLFIPNNLNRVNSYNDKKSVESNVEVIKFPYKKNINNNDKKDDSNIYKKFGNVNTVVKSVSSFSICDNIKLFEKEHKKFKFLIKCNNSSLLFTSIYDNINKLTGGHYSKDLAFQKKCNNLFIQERIRPQKKQTKNIIRNCYNKNYSFIHHSVTNKINKNNKIIKSCTIKPKKTAIEPTVIKIKNIRAINNNNFNEKSLNDINNVEKQIEKNEIKSEPSNEEEDSNFYTKVRTMRLNDIKPVNNLSANLKKKRRNSAYSKNNDLEDIVSDNIFKSSQNLNNPGEFYTDFFKKIIKKQIKKYNKKNHKSKKIFSPTPRIKHTVNNNFFTSCLNNSICGDNNLFNNLHGTHTKRFSDEVTPSNKNRCNRSCLH